MRQKPIIPERSFASLEPSHFSQYSSYLEEAVLNSIHNATVQELITTVSEDGLTLLHQVYGTLDCSPDAAPVKLTVPLSMSQQRRNDTTTPMTGPWEVGQRLKVRITEIDPTSDEITSCALVVTSSTSKLAPSTSSSRKALVEMLPYLGKLVSGRVISTTAYGAFLDIGCKNKNAILHKSRITRTTRVDNVTEFISVGQTLTVRLIEVDIDKGSMALSMLSDKSEQYLQWRKQHAEIRNYRAAARAAASIFDEDNEATKTIANALLDRMNQEEGSKDTKEEEILQGQWGFV
jgi:ribosomal protein S1